MAMKITLEFPVLRNEEDHTDNKQNQEIVAETQIDALPYAILADILTRVPAKTVFLCKTLAKPWLSVIDCPQFAREHFSRSKMCPLLVFTDPLGRKTNRIFHLVEAQTVSDFNPMKLNSRIEFPDVMRGPSSFLRNVNTNVISCEGMLCWGTRRGAGDIVIANPITGEYATLNHHPERGQEVTSTFVGLGFNRVTRTYELLRMTLGSVDDPDCPIAWLSEICTVGSKLWRRCDVVEPQLSFTRKISDVIYVNGSLYWTYKCDTTICRFCFDNASFRVVLLDEIDDLMTSADSFLIGSLGVLDNSLCVSFISQYDGHVELWTLTTTNIVGCQGTWRRVHIVETLTTRYEHSGRLWSRGEYRVIRYLDDGKILLHDWRATFLLYDPVTENEGFFRLLEHSNIEGLRSLLHLQVVPHVPSLVSLKDTLNIQEDNVEVWKTYNSR
ncbi:hypothetical protein DH2020_022654 [Rehmannia glutinosa]|uniref:F-box associated beta-propeller type 3 domain-containing protein n=1 Tax=Rehmannia glutinosa TaxID=99300 RepID=A0ABR0W6R6_REHGL